MNSTKKTARVAGLLWLLNAVTAGFVIYGPLHDFIWAPYLKVRVSSTGLRYFDNRRSLRVSDQYFYQNSDSAILSCVDDAINYAP